MTFASAESYDTNDLPSIIIGEPVKTEIVNARDDNTRLWEVTKWVEMIDPETNEPNVVKVKSYIQEKGCGICYLDDNDNWQVTDTSWQETESGFVTNKANYSLEIGFAADSVMTYIIDGEQLDIAADSIVADDGQYSQNIAVIDGKSIGQIDPNHPEKLIFKDAFGSGIDLEIAAEADGYHQNVIFNEKPVLPQGFNVNNTKILLYTHMDLDSYANSAGVVACSPKTVPIKVRV